MRASGELCVMTHGNRIIPVLFVGNLVFPAKVALTFHQSIKTCTDITRMCVGSEIDVSICTTAFLTHSHLNNSLKRLYTNYIATNFQVSIAKFT